MPDIKTFHDHVKAGDLAAVEAALADDPALLDATNETGQSAFLLAKYYRREPIAEYLLSLKPQMDVFHLCIAGDSAAVLAKIAEDPTLLEAHSTDGWTPLHLAAFFGHADLANVLIDTGRERECAVDQCHEEYAVACSGGGRWCCAD